MSDLNDSVRSLFKGGGILLFGLIIQLGLSFIGQVVIARQLNIADYGTIALASTVAATASTIALLGIDQGLGRFLPRYENSTDRRGVLISSYSVAVPLGLLFGGVLFFTAPFTARELFGSSELIPTLRVFAVVTPFMVTHQLVMSTVQGQQQTVPKVIIENVSRPITRIVGIIIVILLFGASAFKISLAYLVGWLMPVVLGLIYIYYSTDIFDRTVGAATKYKELLTFSFPLLLTGVLTSVFNDLDTLLLGYFIPGTEDVALYNVVYPLANLLITAMSAFGFIFLPIISGLHSEGNYDGLNRMYQVVTKWVFVVTLPVFLVMFTFPSQLISLTYGAKYAYGSHILSILVIGFFIHTIAGMNSQVTSSIGRPKLLMYVNGIAAVMNTILNVLLIPEYGPTGAAIATSVAYILLNVVLSLILYRSEGLFPLTRSMIRPGVIGILVFIIIRFSTGYIFNPGPVVMVVSFILFLSVYGVSILRFGGIEEEELIIFESIEEQLGADLGPLRRLANRLMG